MRGKPVPYMERTRNYYRALGYETDYVWAGGFDDVPFAGLSRPLAQSRIALVTTAGPADRSNRNDAGRKQVWSGQCAHAAENFDVDLAWDREATHTDDRETFLPVDTVEGLARQGFIGSVAEHFHGVPTEYSHRKTMETDAPEILRRMQSEEVDAALLTAL